MLRANLGCFTRRRQGCAEPLSVPLVLDSLSVQDIYLSGAGRCSARTLTYCLFRLPRRGAISPGLWQPTSGRIKSARFTRWPFWRPKLDAQIAILGAAILFSSTVSTALTLAIPVVEAHVMSKRTEIRKAIANALSVRKESKFGHKREGFEAFLELQEEERELLEGILAKLGFDPTCDVDFFSVWDRYSHEIASRSSLHSGTFLLDQSEMSVLLKFLWAKVPRIDYLSKNYDVALTMINCVSSIMDDMRAIGFKAEDGAYRFMVDALLNLERAEAASVVLQSALSAGMTPDPRMYAAVMDSYSRRHEFSSVQKVYEDFLDNGGVPDTSIFNALLRSHFRNRHVAAIRACMEEMDCRAVAMDKDTTDILIEGWAELGDSEKAEMYFFHQVWRAQRPDFRCYAALFRGLAKKGDIARVEALMKRLQSEHTWDPKEYKDHAAVIYSALVELYSQDMKVTRAAFWLKRGQSEGISLTSEAYNALLAAYHRRSMKRQAEELEIEMIRAGIDPQPVSILHAVADEISRARIETAHAIVDNLRKDGEWLFNPHVLRSSQTDLVNRLLEIARRSHVSLPWKASFRFLQRPDRDSYTRFFEAALNALPNGRRSFTSPHAKVYMDPKRYVRSFQVTYDVARRAWESLINTEERFKRLVSPTSEVHAAYMRILARTRGVKEVEDHWRAALSQGINPSRGMFHARIEAYVRTGRVFEAAGILDEEKSVYGHLLLEEYSTFVEGCIRYMQPAVAGDLYPVVMTLVDNPHPPKKTHYAIFRVFLDAIGHRGDEKYKTLLPLGKKILASLIKFHQKLQATEQNIKSRIEHASKLVAQSSGDDASARFALSDLEDQKYQTCCNLETLVNGITDVCCPLFVWLPTVGKDQEALAMFTDLLRAGIVPEPSATTHLISGLAQKPCVRPAAALKLYKALLKSNAPVSFSSGRTVISALGRALRVGDAFAVYQTEMDRMRDATKTAECLQRTRSHFSPVIVTLVNTMSEACVPEAYRLLLDATATYEAMTDGGKWQDALAPAVTEDYVGEFQDGALEVAYNTVPYFHGTTVVSTTPFGTESPAPDIPYYSKFRKWKERRNKVFKHREVRPLEDWDNPRVHDLETRQALLKGILPRLLTDAKDHVPRWADVHTAIHYRFLLMQLFQAEYELLQMKGLSGAPASHTAISEKEQIVDDLEREVTEVNARLQLVRRSTVYCRGQELEGELAGSEYDTQA